MIKPARGDEVQAETASGDYEPGLGDKTPDDPGGGKQKMHKTSNSDLIWQYFLLVLVISIPFWLLGGKKLALPIDLPASSLMFVSPLIAASILTYRRYGGKGLVELYKKAIDYRRINNKLWYLAILALLPVLFVLSYAYMRLTGLPLPADPHIPLLVGAVLFLVFFITATSEELGWMGFAIDPLQDRWGFFRASLLLGIVWSFWHIIPDLQNQKPVDWIVGQRLYSVALRILIVWTYNKTGKSVLAAILLHTMDNVSAFLFPNFGSHYNPFVTGVITWLAAGLAILGWRGGRDGQRRTGNMTRK
jgi:uncharacterized protein